MRYRTFGGTGLRVSDLFLGTMTFGDNWGWGAATDECHKMFDAYAEAGGNVVDTANNYTDGASERIVGEILRGRRDSFVLATKYTLSRDGKDPNASGNHRKNLTRSLEQSLERLGTDYVDVYWVHIWDPRTPVEETMRALDDAVRAGKVLYVGISDAPAWVVSRAQTIAELRGWTPFAGLQVPYSLAQRDVERDLLPMAGALGLSVAAWAPLAQGVLTGKYTRDSRSAFSPVKGGGGAADGGGESLRKNRADISERELRIAREVDAVADDLGVPSSHVAIAWTRAHSRSVHPIVGARNVAQLTDNLAAASLVLPADAVARLDEVSRIELGFPHDFITSTEEFVYGAAAAATE